MSLSSFLAPVLPNFPTVQGDAELEVLQEMPVETLYLALKRADAHNLAWFYQTALPEQIQGLIDIDCWSGGEFLPTRYQEIFRGLVAVNPVKLTQTLKHLDPEVIVRGLLENAEVTDFDPTNPPDEPESEFIISPDSKYILRLKDADSQTREVLFQWMNKLAMGDIELMRRLLESCKWEQMSDLEEFGYQMKKGRLEDMGFVDREEAISLYAVGNAPDFKKALAADPLPAGAKIPPREDDANEPATASQDEAFWPTILAETLQGEDLLAKALGKTSSPELRRTLTSELLRTLNAALAADNLIHSDLEPIAKGLRRSRRYVDLGLSYFSEGQLDRAVEALATQSLWNLHRLGWLAVQDIVRAAEETRKRFPTQIFGVIEENLLQSLKGRHPELDPLSQKDLGLSDPQLLAQEALLRVGIRLKNMHGLGTFFVTGLGDGLRLKDIPLLPLESGYARLLSGLARETVSGDFRAGPLEAGEWETLALELTRPAQRADLKNKTKLVASRCPEPLRPVFEARLLEHLAEFETWLDQKQGARPDPRFFRALAFAGTSASA